MPDDRPSASPAGPWGQPAPSPADDDTAQIPRVDDGAAGEHATQAFAPVTDGPPPPGPGAPAPGPASPPPGRGAPAAAGPSGRSLTVPVLAGGLALVLGIAGVFAYLAVSASGELDRARVRASSAQDRADTAADQLERTQARLAETREALADARRRADDAEGDLTAAEETNATQQQLISDMRVCLDGVLVAMQALGEDDGERAQAELARVKPSCDRAYAQAESLDA